MNPRWTWWLAVSALSFALMGLTGSAGAEGDRRRQKECIRPMGPADSTTWPDEPDPSYEVPEAIRALGSALVKDSDRGGTRKKKPDCPEAACAPANPPRTPEGGSHR